MQQTNECRSNELPTSPEAFVHIQLPVKSTVADRHDEDHCGANHFQVKGKATVRNLEYNNDNVSDAH